MLIQEGRLVGGRKCRQLPLRSGPGSHWLAGDRGGRPFVHDHMPKGHAEDKKQAMTKALLCCELWTEPLA